jgi:hypothetical protein
MHNAKPIQPSATPRNPDWHAGLSSGAAILCHRISLTHLLAPWWIVYTANLPIKTLAGRCRALEAGYPAFRVDASTSLALRAGIALFGVLLFRPVAELEEPVEESLAVVGHCPMEVANDHAVHA